MPATRSCADRLHQLQKDMGFSDKELKQAVKRHTTPREVPLPTIHERVSKYERLRINAEEKSKKRQKYRIAYWYLEKYLKRSEARKIYEEYMDFKELVNHAYELAMNLVQLQSFVLDEDPDAETLIEELEGPKPDGKFDIPKALEKEFDEYAKKHPIKKASEIIPRRKRFRKHRRKRRKLLYSKKRMRIYDPLFANSTLDAKQMYNDLKRIGRENEIRVQKFKEMMESLIQDKSVGSEAMKMFDKRTKVIMDQHRKRLDQFAKQAGLKPNPVMYDFSQLY